MIPNTVIQATCCQKPLPPRILIYGAPGIGKTTWAISASLPVVIRAEDGLAGVPVPAYPVCRSLAELVAQAKAVAQSDYNTLVVDSITRAEGLVWAATCSRIGAKNIEDVGYGKGYIQADHEWDQIFAALDCARDAGKTVIVTASTIPARIELPNQPPTDMITPSLHRRAAARVVEWADIVGYAQPNPDPATHPEHGERVLCTAPAPGHVAKTRYPTIPGVLPLSYAALYTAYAKRFHG